jgi:hypothetical protein
VARFAGFALQPHAPALAGGTRGGFDLRKPILPSARAGPTVALLEEGQGFYSGKLAGDVAGRWLVSIEDPAGQWRLHGEWLADSEEPLRLKAQGEK